MTAFSVYRNRHVLLPRLFPRAGGRPKVCPLRPYPVGPDSSDLSSPPHRGSKTDPHSEIAHIRQSLASLESYLVRTGLSRGNPPSVPVPSVNHHRDPPAIQIPPPLSTDSDDLSNKSAPGMLAQEGQGGLYAGPTSMVTHLLSFKADRESRDGEKKSATTSEPQSASEQIRPYDNDLLEMLPQLHIIDGMSSQPHITRLIEAKQLSALPCRLA